MKIDPVSVLFSEELLDKRLFKKLKKSKYAKDTELLKLINLADNNNFLDDNKLPTRTDYVEKREIDRSTLYSFNGPFQLLHADVGNLEFLGKNATFSQYVLVIVDLYSSKVYTYSMKSRKQILQKMKLFYKLKISPSKIIQNSTLNMNLVKNVKYGLSPEEIESRSLAGKRLKTVFNMHRIEKSQKLHRRIDRYDVMKYSAKRKKLRDELFIGEKVLVLAERIKKKDAPGKFYNQSVQNMPYFNKDRTFIIRKIETISGIR